MEATAKRLSGQRRHADQFSLTYTEHASLKKPKFRASLVVQWLRIRLPRQETRVRAPVREDPTGRGATKPVCHNY